MPTVTVRIPSNVLYSSTKSCSSPGVSVPSSVACNGPSPSDFPRRYLREAVGIAPTVRIHGQMSGIAYRKTLLGGVGVLGRSVQAVFCVGFNVLWRFTCSSTVTLGSMLSIYV